ncbi:hypothetical protein DFH11DRAFT_278387 [Phellopilus nigrolimitatus]|nr:hypothetical protein DFH11DRAFT_278387 [Phellopilus nigrolimitatus]
MLLLLLPGESLILKKVRRCRCRTRSAWEPVGDVGLLHIHVRIFARARARRRAWVSLRRCSWLPGGGVRVLALTVPDTDRKARFRDLDLDLDLASQKAARGDIEAARAEPAEPTWRRRQRLAFWFSQLPQTSIGGFRRLYCRLLFRTGFPGKSKHREYPSAAVPRLLPSPGVHVAEGLSQRSDWLRGGEEAVGIRNMSGMYILGLNAGGVGRGGMGRKRRLGVAGGTMPDKPRRSRPFTAYSIDTFELARNVLSMNCTCTCILLRSPSSSAR